MDHHSAASCLNNRLNHIIDHFIRHSRIHAYPEGVIHNEIRIVQSPGYPVCFRIPDLIKAGVLDEIAAEQQTRLDIVFFHIAGHIIPIQATIRFYRNQESEPGRTAIGYGLRQNQFVRGGRTCQRIVEPLPVVPTALSKAGKFLKLLTANRRLHIRNLQIIAKVAVYILVVIALRQLAVLTIKAVPTEIILAGGADAVPAPIPEG